MSGGVQLAPDPELADLLALPQPDLDRLDPSWLRSAVRRPYAARAPGDHVTAVHDEVVPAPHPVPVRVYVPEGNGPFGVVVFLHGSGWVIFDLDSYDYECRAMAAVGRVVVVSVGYRLAPEHRFPGAILDVLEAVAWTTAEAARFGGDPGRLAIAGDSAGGNLAAVACQRLLAAGGPMPRLQALVYPVTDLRGGHESRQRHATDGYLTTAMLEWFERQYVRDDADRHDPRVSPLAATDLAGLPPAVVVTAGFDPLADEGAAYADRLAAAAVPVDGIHFPTAVHGVFQQGATTRIGREVLERTARAVGQALRA